MKGSVAFDVCHEIYTIARELVDSRLSTTQMTSTSKFLWRPDLRPRLVEYVADFALAGERALADDGGGRRRRGVPPPKASRGSLNLAPGGKPLRASRLILFRLYYLGGAEYRSARNLLGLSERTWSDWTDEIRTRVGRELLRGKMFPPSRYFRQIG